MDTLSLDVKIPADLLTILRKSREEMRKEVQQWVALELFRQRTVSAGKAAELADLPLADFMNLAREHQIEWVSYTDAELASELRPRTPK